MFENIENNKIMILGAYRKLKSYYYYDKSILYNKMRLATWESPLPNMNSYVDDLAKFMCSLETEVDTTYLSMLFKNISLVPMPKSFEEQKKKEDVLTNSLFSNKKLSKINFYIKAPVEILILDMIWSLMISKIAHEQACIPQEVYANRIKTRQVFLDNYDLFSGIDFESNRLFYPYFRQYSMWRNNAFTNVRERYDAHKDSILVSLDIKSYFYSVAFDFERLPILLKDDSRLKKIAPLTQIIQSIYISYTSELQKFRSDIPADVTKNQSALPIGLISSSILANLYLKDFDNAVLTNIKPTYYGRYVDDVIFVVDKNADMDISREYIIEKLLIKNDIVESREESYKILQPQEGSLWLQKDKIRCIYFDHSEPDAMIKLLCEAGNLTPSMTDGFLFPDIDISKNKFDDFAYSIEQGNGTLKVRNFSFSTNNFQASLFLNDLIRASKNVNVIEPEHSDNIQTQLSQIVRFYSSLQSIEFRSAWINIFSLILLNERYDFFLQFYNQVYDAIDSIFSDSIDFIAPSKLDYILGKLKESLHEQLAIAASISIAPHALQDVRVALVNTTYNEKYPAFANDCEIIFDNARDIRNANMFNNHILAYPLLSYIQNVDENVSLVKTDPNTIRQYFCAKELDQDKVMFLPRFIHLEELYLLCFMINYSEGGNPFCNKIKSIDEQFASINRIASRTNTLNETNPFINKNDSLQTIRIIDSETKNNMKVALASIYIDEHDDVIPVLDNPNYNLLPNKKRELYQMLNEAKGKKAEMVIFPEFFLPIQWLQEILIFARKNRIAIMSGLRYLVCNKQAFNYLVVLQPFSADGFKYSVPLFREKNYYAPAEKIELAKKQLRCNEPDNKSIHLIDWNGLKYSNLMCYELTNIEYRYALRGLIDLLVVPELNRDTSYFSNVVEATTRDLHAFIVQVNTSKYGDSRITGPYNSLYKDIIKLKGGKDNIILTGTIDVLSIEENRNTYAGKLEEKIQQAFDGELKAETENKKKTKDPVAGFKMEV